ncbi:RCC1 domain-containing protein [Colletotrichum sublineola]|uniref:Putative RCC1 domain-containing protein n=1 Tax=Colletotrichum sublineola TaxID=1173701 RepID=A0A066XRV7_COLSU|nr:RCC1 domain-containing protein [Colletotrichum sublineola]KDN71978.1 putative RCC1 domain-containing protein [Colletotrichum sublineola]
MSVLFAIGSNGSGQLGIGHKEDVSVPKQAIFFPDHPDSPVVKMAAGGNHTLLLTQSGELYWSGDPTSGACGLTSTAETTEPIFQRVQLSKEGEENASGTTDLIAATWEASFVVQKDAEGRRTKVYSFGAGQKGELGLGELIVRSPSATLFKEFPPAGTEVVDLAACMGHAVAVLSDGAAYAWGNIRKGQGGSPEAVVHSPRKIEGVDFKVHRAVCGKDFTCLFGTPESGKLLILGSDKWNIKSSAPETVPEWSDVGASWGNVYVLKKDGDLLSWGRDDHGQLPPPGLPKLSNIAIGSEHVTAFTEKGDVLAWGWGEHGNCGPQVENNDVKGRWNVIASSKFIPPGSQIAGIGAGCATSWVTIITG